jgi:ketosteroid isomerase-like protein
MSDYDLMRSIAHEFVAACNGRDLERLDRLFHADFRWHIAITDHGDPQLRPLHSHLLRGLTLPWQKAIYTKAETLDIFSRLFTIPQFSVDLRSVIANEDRAALELVGNGVNPANNRRYDNLYCYIFERRGDQLVLFREYQDTLLLFDVWVAE